MKREIVLLTIAIAVAATAAFVWHALNFYQREMSQQVVRNLNEERFRIGLSRSSMSLSSFAMKWPRHNGLDRLKMSEGDLKRYGIALYVFLEGTTEPFFANEQLGMVQHVAEVEYRDNGSGKKLSKITVYGYPGRLLPYEFFFDEKTVIRVSVPLHFSL
jgi:hypothetical protein